MEDEELELIENRHFEEEEVPLDGRRFVGCTFTDCVLIYGGGPVSFDPIDLENPEFRFVGSASRTFSFLNYMVQAGLELPVAGIVDQIFGKRAQFHFIERDGEEVLVLDLGPGAAERFRRQVE